MKKGTEKTLLPIGKLVNWNKNPRSMNPEEKERLKKQLNELGQYKPLIVTMDGQYAVVLGGNMRLEAMRELNKEDPKGGWGEVWVSIVEAGTEKERLEYALSDNDRAGHYNEDQLVALARAIPGFDVANYNIDTAYTVGLDTVIARYDMADVRARGPGAGERVDTNTVKDKKERYDAATIKQIVLYFGLVEYEKILKLLEQAMTDFGVDNNTEAAVKMFQFYEDHREKTA